MYIYSRSVRRHFLVFYEPSYASAIFRSNSTSLWSRIYDTTLRCITVVVFVEILPGNVQFLLISSFWLAKVSRRLKVTDEIIFKIPSECTRIFLAEKKWVFKSSEGRKESEKNAYMNLWVQGSALSAAFQKKYALDGRLYHEWLDSKIFIYIYFHFKMRLHNVFQR